MSDNIILQCQKLLQAYENGDLSEQSLPEDISPDFGENDFEGKLFYFTLPMCMNYRRNSNQLWEASLKTYNDNTVNDIFSIKNSAEIPTSTLAKKLLKYKMAMQPTRHTLNWQTISKTIYKNWGSIKSMLDFVDYDFLILKDTMQSSYKKGFPYLSGPKLFNYWAYIMSTKCEVNFKNKDKIDIAVDTHVAKCSVKLGVITKKELEKMSTEKIAERWRNVLNGSGVAPVDLNIPLWFWSRNNFIYKIN